MTTKIIAFYDFIGMVAASRVRARGYSRGAAEATYSRPPDTRHIPHLRTPLECRWQIDPLIACLMLAVSAIVFEVNGHAPGAVNLRGRDLLPAVSLMHGRQFRE